MGVGPELVECTCYKNDGSEVFCKVRGGYKVPGMGESEGGVTWWEGEDGTLLKVHQGSGGHGVDVKELRDGSEGF